ncbi:unnamed protein product [Schistosoma rodhaini]|uniref:Snake toxin/toxin-like domain-containing protein n=1 Tax=Schistosoma rodhaini TaxID=6188 RepID=A0AA85EV93_9TREM|nr:unnamed protein product [Schistosoma rodhaini]
MESNIKILLTILVFVMNTDYTFSAKCYECARCPFPFNRSSSFVSIRSGCKWCVSLSVGSPYFTTKHCADWCESKEFFKEYNNYNYTCCNTNLCNVSSKICTTYKILFLPLLIIYFYFNVEK